MGEERESAGAIESVRARDSYKGGAMIPYHYGRSRNRTHRAFRSVSYYTPL
jgi:hypothetical protein